MLRNVGLRKSVEQPVLDLNFAASQIGSNAAPDSRIDFSRGSNAWFVDSDGLFKKSPHNLMRRSEDLTTSWTTFQASIVANAAASPTGDLTADKVVADNSASICTCNQSIALPDSTVFVFSAYLKAAGHTVINLQFYNKTNAFHGSGNFDLTTGTRSGSPAAGTESSIENVGNGWYRITFSGLNTGTGGQNPNFRFVCNETGDGSKGFLVWGAQVSQHTTLPVDNPYIKTGGSAVYAARLDHDPTWLMSAAQEQNLLQYSEAIDDSYWNKIRTTVTANAIEAPDGTVTAELLAEDSSANQTHVVRQNTVTDIPQTEGKSYAFSGYVKAGGRNRVRIRFEHAAHQADLRLDDGTFTNNGFDSVTLTDVGNGWFRFVAVETADSRQPLVQIMLVNDSGQSTYTGDGSSGVYVWGLQLEVGTASDTYHRTEGQIYLGPGATPKGLLIEEARTNIAPNSHQFTANSGVTRSGELIFAPDAVNEGDSFTISSGSSEAHQIGMSGMSGSAVTIGTVHTVSFFAKLLNGTPNIGVRGFGKGGSNQHPIFNVSNGTVANVGSSWESGTKIEDFGNGWFRCSCVVNPSAQFAPIIHMLESGDNQGVLTYTGNGTDKIALWGGQVEVGSFVTSHIPTSGSTVTRNADVATMGPTTGGTELIANGTFDTDTNNWQAGTATLSSVSGKLRVTSTGGDYPMAFQTLTTVVGRRYRLTVDVTVGNTPQGAVVQVNAETGQGFTSSSGLITSNTTYTTDFTANITNVNILLHGHTGTSAGQYQEFDNVSVRELYPFEQFEQSQGTIVAEITHETVANPSSTYYPATLVFKEGGAAGNGIYFINAIGPAFSQDTTRYAYIKADGANQVNGLGQKVDPGVPFVQALSYATNNVDQFISGDVPSGGQSDNSCTLPHPDQIVFNNDSKGAYYIKRLTYFNRKVSDDTLQFLSDV